MVCREGTWGAEFHRCLPAAGDVVVQKHRYSAFHGTELQHVLHALGRTTVALTGTSTNVCVESTARDACMLDYEVVVVDDATCADTEAEHAAALFNIRRLFWERPRYRYRRERVDPLTTCGVALGGRPTG